MNIPHIGLVTPLKLNAISPVYQFVTVIEVVHIEPGLHAGRRRTTVQQTTNRHETNLHINEVFKYLVGRTRRIKASEFGTFRPWWKLVSVSVTVIVSRKRRPIPTIRAMVIARPIVRANFADVAEFTAIETLYYIFSGRGVAVKRSTV